MNNKPKKSSLLEKIQARSVKVVVKSTPMKITKHGAIEQLPPPKPNNKTRELIAAAESVKPHLKRGKDNALTMRALAKKLKCSKGAAERRFNLYVKRFKGLDQKLKSVPVREGDRGPEGIGFYL